MLKGERPVMDPLLQIHKYKVEYVSIPNIGDPIYVFTCTVHLIHDFNDLYDQVLAGSKAVEKRYIIHSYISVQKLI